MSRSENAIRPYLRSTEMKTSVMQKISIDSGFQFSKVHPRREQDAGFPKNRTVRLTINICRSSAWNLL